MTAGLTGAYCEAPPLCHSATAVSSLLAMVLSLLGLCWTVAEIAWVVGRNPKGLQAEQAREMQWGQVSNMLNPCGVCQVGADAPSALHF